MPLTGWDTGISESKGSPVFDEGRYKRVRLLDGQGRRIRILSNGYLGSHKKGTPEEIVFHNFS